MIGQEKLLAMRRMGRKPVGVWITDGPTRCAADWHREANPYLGRYCPAVSLDETDVPELVDLRFAVGLTVLVGCLRGDARGRRLHNALVAAKAQTVATVLSNEVLFHA